MATNDDPEKLLKECITELRRLYDYAIRLVHAGNLRLIGWSFPSDFSKVWRGSLSIMTKWEITTA